MPKILFYFVIFCLILTAPALATSLWVDSAAEVYQDDIAREIGDLLTIIIVENSAATQKASTKTSQDSEVGAGPGAGIFDFVDTFSLKYDDQNSADGTTTRQGTISANITVQIIDKQPNGNLIVQGFKKINVNGEVQEIEITGVIRLQDINSDNTIQSTYMMDTEIRFSGQGVVGDKQNAGLLERLFNWLF